MYTPKKKTAHLLEQVLAQRATDASVAQLHHLLLPFLRYAPVSKEA